MSSWRNVRHLRILYLPGKFVFLSEKKIQYQPILWGICEYFPGKQRWFLENKVIPHICRFWGASTLSRPVKRAPKSPWTRDKIAITCQNGQKIAFSMLKGHRLEKNTSLPVLGLVIYMGYEQDTISVKISIFSDLMCLKSLYKY